MSKEEVEGLGLLLKLLKTIFIIVELMKIVDEVRHLDGLIGGIAVSELEYMGTTTMHEANS